MITIETKVNGFTYNSSQMFSDELLEMIDWLNENVGPNNEAWNIHQTSKHPYASIILWKDSDAPLVKLRWA